MSGNSHPLEKMLEEYAAVYADELKFIGLFRELLRHPDAYERTHLPGHITGSAFIVSEDWSQTLLVHHAKLNRWLQPGGHADGDHHVERVALREANEETGLKEITLVTPEIFDVDIHPIPARKDFGAHDHYDVRFLYKASINEKIVVSEESHDVKWVDLGKLEEYSFESSLLRMRDKFLAFKK
ncbi:MAG TPA: NUDIX hydrolase [Cyclobacteriaceae bacterium]|nr:NUDIX hydrolase [Cyclobacteriaceae bacterium]